VFIANATAICSLWQGLRPTTVPTSTQCCIPSGLLNRVPALAGVHGQECHLRRVAGNTVCPTWHASSRIAVTQGCQRRNAIPRLVYLLHLRTHVHALNFRSFCVYVPKSAVTSDPARAWSHVNAA